MKDKIIRVLIADDHDIIRKGLNSIIGFEEDLELVGEAENGEKVLKLLDIYDADVVLLDLNMPLLNGIEVIKKLKEQGNTVKIILLTIENSERILNEAINSGADGYVLKDSAGVEIVDAIRRVHNGEKYIDKTLVSALFENIKKKQGEANSKLSILSKRELEVLLEISRGYSNKEIGQKLYLSEKSVKNYATNLFRKLDVHDRVQATIIALGSTIEVYYKSKYND